MSDVDTRDAVDFLFALREQLPDDLRFVMVKLDAVSEPATAGFTLTTGCLLADGFTDKAGLIEVVKRATANARVPAQAKHAGEINAVRDFHVYVSNLLAAGAPRHLIVLGIEAVSTMVALSKNEEDQMTNETNEDMAEINRNRDLAREDLRMAAMNFTAHAGKLSEDVDNKEQQAEVTRAMRALETAARQFASVELMLLSATLDAADAAKRAGH